MELQGSSYLYALATLSITFSGFSAIITVLRQVSGGSLSRYESFLMVNYFLTGFAIALLCLMPPLLSGWGTNTNVVWRTPSAIAAIMGIAVEVASLWRRPRITGAPTPSFVWAISISYWPAFILLIMSALHIGVIPGFGPFAASLTWIFAMAAVDYVIAIEVLFDMQRT